MQPNFSGKASDADVAKFKRVVKDLANKLPPNEFRENLAETDFAKFRKLDLQARLAKFPEYNYRDVAIESITCIQLAFENIFLVLFKPFFLQNEEGEITKNLDTQLETYIKSRIPLFVLLLEELGFEQQLKLFLKISEVTGGPDVKKTHEKHLWPVLKKLQKTRNELAHCFIEDCKYGKWPLASPEGIQNFKHDALKAFNVLHQLYEFMFAVSICLGYSIHYKKSE